MKIASIMLVAALTITSGQELDSGKQHRQLEAGITEGNDIEDYFGHDLTADVKARQGVYSAEIGSKGSLSGAHVVKDWESGARPVLDYRNLQADTEGVGGEGEATLDAPTPAPDLIFTQPPTLSPTLSGTVAPSAGSSESPTLSGGGAPTTGATLPTAAPTARPTAGAEPTAAPTSETSAAPSESASTPTAPPSLSEAITPEPTPPSALVEAVTPAPPVAPIQETTKAPLASAYTPTPAPSVGPTYSLTNVTTTANGATCVQFDGVAKGIFANATCMVAGCIAADVVFTDCEDTVQSRRQRDRRLATGEPAAVITYDINNYPSYEAAQSGGGNIVDHGDTVLAYIQEGTTAAQANGQVVTFSVASVSTQPTYYVQSVAAPTPAPTTAMLRNDKKKLKDGAIAAIIVCTIVPAILAAIGVGVYRKRQGSERRNANSLGDGFDEIGPKAPLDDIIVASEQETRAATPTGVDVGRQR